MGDKITFYLDKIYVKDKPIQEKTLEQILKTIKGKDCKIGVENSRYLDSTAVLIFYDEFFNCVDEEIKGKYSPTWDYTIIPCLFLKRRDEHPLIDDGEGKIEYLFFDKNKELAEKIYVAFHLPTAVAIYNKNPWIGNSRKGSKILEDYINKIIDNDIIKIAQSTVKFVPEVKKIPNEKFTELKDKIKKLQIKISTDCIKRDLLQQKQEDDNEFLKIIQDIKDKTNCEYIKLEVRAKNGKINANFIDNTIKAKDQISIGDNSIIAQTNEAIMNRTVFDLLFDKYIFQIDKINCKGLKFSEEELKKFWSIANEIHKRMQNLSIIDK